MVQFINITGYDEMKKAIESYEKDARLLYLYFEGQHEANGKSWCPDCSTASPFVMNAFKNYCDPTARALIVDVGSRDYWKDRNSPFRKDKLNLKVIPTLLRWNGFERLEGHYCQREDILQMFFDESKEEE